MPVEHPDELLGMLHTDEFGVGVEIGGSGSTFMVCGILDREHIAVLGETSEINTGRPILHCRSIDVGDVEQGMSAVVNGVTYRIVDIQPDGTGVTDLALHLDPDADSNG